MSTVVIAKVEPSNQKGAIIGAAITNIPNPSGYDWNKMDISGQEAGRKITTNMWKNLQAKARTLEIIWENKPADVISSVLSIFDQEYMWITFYDALTGSEQRKHFYGGDMSASLYSMNTASGEVWSVAKIKLIQSITDKV